MPDMFPYRVVLGDMFTKLHPVLQRFHGQPSNQIANGVLEVSAGETRAARLVGRLMGLPGPGRQVPIRLEVERAANGETWTRSFPDRTLVTRQWACRDLLWESIGGTAIGFQLSVVDGCLQLQSISCRQFGVPLPRSLAPLIEATERGMSNGWQLSVAVHQRRLGLLTAYSGQMEYQ